MVAWPFPKAVYYVAQVETYRLSSGVADQLCRRPRGSRGTTWVMYVGYSLPDLWGVFALCVTHIATNCSIVSLICTSSQP